MGHEFPFLRDFELVEQSVNTADVLKLGQC